MERSTAPSPTSHPAITVSVVIAAYNAAATITDALESVHRQQYPPIEIIVVDDGSTDDTIAVVERSGLASAIIRQANQGPSRARNAGVRAAHGDWIAFLDADDVWHPAKLAEQVAVVERHGDAAIVATDWARALDQLGLPAASRLEWFGYRDLVVLNRFQTSTVLMRRAVLDAIGGFDASLDGVEDWDCWLRGALHGPVALLHAPLVLYRDSPGGVSKDLRRLRAGAIAVMERERQRGVLHPDDAQDLLAWHLERLFVAEVLVRDWPGALDALKDVLLAPPHAHLRAARGLLGPFLLERLNRRRGRAAA